MVIRNYNSDLFRLFHLAIFRFDYGGAGRDYIFQASETVYIGRHLQTFVKEFPT